MEVNREWWSGTERYINNSDNIDPEHVVTTIGDLSTDIPANPTKYIGVEWDKSICPWKINYKSDFFNPQWCLPYYQSGGGDFKMVQAPFFKERKKGYTFYMCAAGGVASYQPHEVLSYYAATKPCWINLLSRTDIDITQNPSQQWVYEKFYKTFPVVNFDYSKLFVAPMIHTESGSGWVFHDDAQIREDWDPTGVYGISLMFYVKDPYNSSDLISVGIHSLNNKIAPPPWDTTNCWNEDKMFDNGLALSHWNSWDGGWEIGGIQTLGTECTWSDSGASAGDPGFNDTPYASDDVAGAILYYPAKNIMIQMPADSDDGTLWDDWIPYYKGGSHEYGVRRHLKSTVTYDQFADYLKKQLAYLGFRFCIDGNHFGDPIDSQYYFIPEIDSKGVTTGNYYQANSTEAQNLPNNSWTTDVYQETPYDGTDDEEEEDPNEYENNPNTHWGTTKFDPGYGTKECFMTEKALYELLYTLSEFKGNEASGNLPKGFCEQAFGHSDPLEIIQSIVVYPYDITYNFLSDTSQVKISGNHPVNYFDVANTSIAYNVGPPTGERQPYNMYVDNASDILEVEWGNSNTETIPTYNTTIADFYPREGNFLDQAPYTSAEINIPFCGSVSLDPAIYNGHKIGIVYTISPPEGTCKASILRDGYCVDNITGNIGTPITISSSDVVAKANAVNQTNAIITAQKTKAATGILTTAAAAGITLATGGATTPMVMAGLGAASSLINTSQSIDQAQYKIDTMETPFRQITSGSGYLAMKNETGVLVNFWRPKYLNTYNKEKYGHTVGFATLANSELKNYHGLTVVDTVDLTGVSCTEKEAEMIKSALKSGVYLP